MQVFRISKSKFAKASFTGEGARLYQGRWNPAGVRMVYTSSSLALAALEFFVHIDPSASPDDLVSVSATIPLNKVKVEKLTLSELPKDWRRIDHPALQAIGAKWIDSDSSAALEVPSVVVEGEWNVLLNPAHPQFKKIVIAVPRPFHFDSRMYKLSR